ncbi:Rne/Rng family ribonuclease [uncultured Dietzia sp.]|uniref:Rne/Rng family ribonuclease n=1 Tax=uncultured Dietzia sp. TaxID=395519 RepID=UPI0025E7F9C0|nr:Rne/Rng family ribonuclease [uncultured Dietzia sp.]
MSDPNLTIDHLNALPERMRAHAAAKAVGMTSKEFLAAMSGIGVEIKSAQSGVTREVLLTWFEGRQRGTGAATDAAAAPAPTAAEPETASDAGAGAGATAAPAKKTSARKAAAKKAPAKSAAKKALARESARSQDPAAQAPAAQDSTAAGSAADTVATGSTDQVTTEPAPAAKKAPARKRSPKKSTAPQADTAAPATSSERPALPEAIVTGEVGSAESGNRRRRSSASPSFSPLFLSPEESEAQSSRASGSDRPGSRDSGGRASGSGAAGGDTARGTDGSDAGGDETGQDGTRDDDDQSSQGEGGNRRRRRGRRGRGRGRGEGGDDQNQNADDDAADQSGGGSGTGSGSDTDGRDDADGGDDKPTTGRDGSAGTAPGASDDADSGTDSNDPDSDDDSDGSDSSPSGSRRRRRRRRRSGGSGSGSDDNQGAADDPPNTEIHERDGRRRSGRGGQSSGTATDEVQGITGSTRLEAKRQRRRDGREAGRRRQPILSESEFLARRESVDRVMVVREKPRVDGKGIMTQVGVLEDKVLVEHFVTTESARSMVGNVYLGRVQNVLPSMEAAFVDIGRGRNGVLYAGEVNWEAAGLGGKARRIEQALKPGDMVLVQVTKDPVGQKGARLSTQISLAGRFLVYVPDGNSAGISRKLPDTERRRLKAILKDVVPEGSGVIIRTAAEGVSEEEIGRDVERLAVQWTEISEDAAKRTSSGAGNPVALYEEPDLLVKVVRDLFNEDFTKLVIQGETSWKTVHDYVSRVAPEMVERLERYDNPEVDVFATHRVDEQLAKALERKVWLPSGGSLVIDRTEAMTVIDVNTGKYTGSGGNLEETVTKNNLEAAEEIVRQLRLRDVGGMVIIDFIDMVLEGNRDLVLRRLTEALGRDRTRHQVSEVTSLGLVQLTRKKLGTGLVEAFSTPCEHCHGRGLIVHADPIHTESHNADEPGTRRGRRRGGKGGDSASPSSEPAATKQAPRKEGPAPSAHPAALAMGRQTPEADGTATDDGRAEKPAAAASTAAESTPAVDEATSATATTPADTSSTDTATDSADAAAAAAGSAPATEKAGESDDSSVAESSDAAGATRPSRRRRATRRSTSSAPAPSTAARDSAAAEVAETPQAETAAVAEAAEAVAEVAPADGAAGTAAGETADGGSSGTQADGQSGRRPRRRSGRREAGAAVAAAAPESAPGAPAAKVEAAALAEAPTAVVAEPRQRPARRRATRSTTAPGGA